MFTLSLRERELRSAAAAPLLITNAPSDKKGITFGEKRKKRKKEKKMLYVNL